MNVWKCNLIFTSDTLQQNIEITVLKPLFLAGALMVLASSVSILQDRYAPPNRRTEFNNASVRSVWALEGLRRRMRRNLHLARNKMDVKDGVNGGEECSCRRAKGTVCEREGGCTIRAQQMWPAGIRLERESDEPSTPYGEIHLHNLCQQVPNGPKKKEWRKHLQSNCLGFNSQLQLTEV